MSLASVLEAVRADPVAATLEFGSLGLSVLLPLLLVGAFATGLPTRSGGLWLAVVVLGAGFVAFWTVVWPLFERF